MYSNTIRLENCQLFHVKLDETLASRWSWHFSRQQRWSWWSQSCWEAEPPNTWRSWEMLSQEVEQEGNQMGQPEVAQGGDEATESSILKSSTKSGFWLVQMLEMRGLKDSLMRWVKVEVIYNNENMYSTEAIHKNICLQYRIQNISDITPVMLTYTLMIP